MVIVAELLLGRESDVPVPLQGAGYQSIGWIDALVAPARQRGLIRGPFQPLFPLPTQLLTFEFEIFGDLKAHLDGGGRECLEHRGADERIDTLGADRLAARRPSAWSRPAGRHVAQRRCALGSAPRSHKPRPGWR